MPETPVRSRRPRGPRRPRTPRTPKRSLPLLLVALALVVTGVGAFQAYAAQRSHRETAEALLRDYGVFAAWSFAERASVRLDNAVHTTLLPVRRDLLEPDVRALDEILAAGRQRDESGCGVALAGRFAFHARPGADPAGLVFAGEAPPAPAATRLREALTRDVRAQGARESGPEHPRVLEVPGGEGMLVAYVRLTGAPGDTAVYGVEVDRTRLEAELRTALDDPDLLPASLTRGAPNDSLLDVRVLGHEGDALFASATGEAPAIHADQPLAGWFDGAVVRAAVLPAAADRLIIGGMPGDRTPALLLMFVLAAGLMVLSVSLLRKEGALARMRSDFVASVSHELRTPLAQIRLFAETVRLGRTRSDAERDWALDRIARETERLTGLVEKVLHFHRAERGDVPVERELADVGAVVAEATSSFGTLLRPGAARLDLDVRAGLLAPLHTDSFRQVVLNLLENAVKYGPAGQTVRIIAERKDGLVRLVVEDEGPGIAPAEREAIWEPFHRGESAMASAIAGGGIGLSVVREIVRAHGGRVRVEDAPGGGARFVVEVPGGLTAESGGLPAEAAAEEDRTAAGAA